MKKTFTGWIRKSEKGLESFHWVAVYSEPELSIPDVFKEKDKEDSWDKEDWPPKKVKITIEILP